MRLQIAIKPLVPCCRLANTNEESDSAFYQITCYNHYCVHACSMAMLCADPYVKIWLQRDGKKIEKRKSTIVEKSLNPVFNETFLFCVPYEHIRQTSLAVSVMDYDRMGRNERIGQVVLGAKSGPMEVKHWNEMFAKPRQEVIQWHILKDFGWLVTWHRTPWKTFFVWASEMLNKAKILRLKPRPRAKILALRPLWPRGLNISEGRGQKSSEMTRWWHRERKRGTGIPSTTNYGVHRRRGLKLQIFVGLFKILSPQKLAIFSHKFCIFWKKSYRHVEYDVFSDSLLLLPATTPLMTADVWGSYTK